MSENIHDLRIAADNAKKALADKWEGIHKLLASFSLGLRPCPVARYPYKLSCKHFWMSIVMIGTVALPFSLHFGKQLMEVGLLEAGLKNKRTTLARKEMEEKELREKELSIPRPQVMVPTPRAVPMAVDDEEGSKLYLILGMVYLAIFLLVLSFVSIKLTYPDITLEDWDIFVKETPTLKCPYFPSCIP